GGFIPLATPAESPSPSIRIANLLIRFMCPPNLLGLSRSVFEPRSTLQTFFGRGFRARATSLPYDSRDFYGGRDGIVKNKLSYLSTTLPTTDGRRLYDRRATRRANGGLPQRTRASALAVPI